MPIHEKLAPLVAEVLTALGPGYVQDCGHVYEATIRRTGGACARLVFSYMHLHNDEVMRCAVMPAWSSREPSRYGKWDAAVVAVRVRDAIAAKEADDARREAEWKAQERMDRREADIRRALTNAAGGKNAGWKWSVDLMTGTVTLTGEMSVERAKEVAAVLGTCTPAGMVPVVG